MVRPWALLVAGLSAFAMTGCGEEAASPSPSEGPAPRSTAGLSAEAPILFHRATYEMRLRSARSAADLTDLRGTMTTEFADACEGYTFNQDYDSQFTDLAGNVRLGELRVASYESKDGRLLRFSIRNTMDGAVVESASGMAMGGPGSEGGEATYDAGEPKRIPLPAGTLFPTEHGLALVRAAREGKTRLVQTLFDGSVEREVYEAYATIGPPKAAWDGPSIDEVPGAGGFSALTSWPVTISYFVAGSKADLPEYEVTFRLFANGATSGLTLNFGDYVIAGTLTRIETLPAPAC